MAFLGIMVAYGIASQHPEINRADVTPAGTSGDGAYLARVIRVNEHEICLDGGPVRVERCEPRDQIANLPSSVDVGECLLLQEEQSGTHYLRTTTCPD